jgi:hypothetical protein
MLDIENSKIILIDNYEKIDIFITFLKKFCKYNINKNRYISIDFEYTKHKIQLWQICFYYKNNNIIYVIVEKYINENTMNIIIKKLLISNIIKIFHGGESLDFPYLIKDVLKTSDNIYKFLKYTFDTKFLCEYYKIFKSEKQICNIYDAMLSFNVIDKNKYNELENINKSNGPIWKVNWNNIGTNNNLLIYTVFDVVYLKKLLFNLYELYKKNNLKNDFYELQKINIYVMLYRNNINYNYKLNINNLNKYKIINYYKNVI